MKRCDASRLLTGSKLTFVLKFALRAVQGDVVCCFLIHTASREVVGKTVVLILDKAPGFPLLTFSCHNVHVTVFQ